MFYLAPITTVPTDVTLEVPIYGDFLDVVFSLELQHTATNKTYTFTPTQLQSDNYFLTIKFTFDEIPFVGQYYFALKNATTHGVYFATILEIEKEKKEIPQSNNITTLSQYNE